MNKFKLQALLNSFFQEDIGDGDITSASIFNHTDLAEGLLTVKTDGVFAGLDVISEGFTMGNSSIIIEPFVNDGEHVSKGQDLAFIKGPVIELLSRERVILNLIQRMSGIATKTYQAIKILNSSHTQICDTRKTVPGLRMLDKYAVTFGGGVNHRFGLYDGVMIKDNHIEYMGSITKAVEAVRARLGHMVKIEVETESEAQVFEAVEARADVIMFDNRSPEEVKSFVQLVPDYIITEASGGITLGNLQGYSNTGVDYISLGLLTHSVKALDISFNILKGVENLESIRSLSK